MAKKWADPACPGSEVVQTVGDGEVEIIIDNLGFWARCTVPNCGWVSDDANGFRGRFAAKYKCVQAAEDHINH